jgi:transposase
MKVVMSKFINLDRETMLLLPPSINEWLPKRHLARLVVEIVNKLDLSQIEKTYPVNGGWTYQPSMMISLLFYAYITGIQSTRKIENATYDSLAFRFIAGNLHPDHDTIADFRVRFLPYMDSIFLQILKICMEMNLTKVGNINLTNDIQKSLQVATDGTKILANASKHKALSYEHAQKLEMKLKEEIAQLKTESEKAEKADSVDEINIPKELERREERLSRISEAKTKIEKRAKERFDKEQKEYSTKIAQREQKEKETGKKPGGKPPEPPSATPEKHDQINLTDEESRIMPKAGGEFVQAYNAQVTVDMGSMLILTARATQAANDKQQLVPTIQDLKKIEQADIGVKIDTMTADTGYFSENNITESFAAEINPLIPRNREAHNTWLDNRQKDFPQEPIADDLVARAKQALNTSEGKKIYARRKSTIEPVFGIIKNVMHFTRFSMRGLKNAHNELTLVSAAWNIKRLFNLAV